ncbi:MAG: NAD(+) diphosphatase [Promicromonosporaceae bacterium]|nr:NAD(+) diphosphatase [Promicromonosporaceae bacterium]
MLNPLPPLDLPLARALHDRAAERRDDPGLLAALYKDPATRVLVLHGDRLAVGGEGRGAHLALLAPAGLPAPAEAGPTPPPHYDAADDPVDVRHDVPVPPPPLWFWLGEHDGVHYVALAGAAGDERPTAAGAWATLRELDALDHLEQGLATQAVALAGWHAVHGFCPRCGAPTQVRKAGWVRWCPVEDRELYPRTDPAVIMTVVDDDDRLLLGHAAHWPEGRFSTLAGFVEPGESLEQAVRREVAEEVHVHVADGLADVVYRGSQAWPFPASLMVGFRAHVTGHGIEARTDGVELTDARWFTREELLKAVETGEVRLPTRLSIARALIEEWYGGRLPGEW